VNNPKYWVVIAAAGIGQRMKNSIPKQYLPLSNKTVIEYALAPFLDNPQFEKIIVVIAENDSYWHNLMIASNPKILTVIGDAERYQTVLNGLAALNAYASENDWVLVHDAARPLITTNEITSLIIKLEGSNVGGLLAMPVFATIKQIDAENKVVTTVPRQHLWQAATPQMFRYGLLTKALQTVIPEQAPSDCSQAIEKLGYNPLIVECSQRNFKITCPADLELAQKIVG
jgi:2-C-methyl-D-erythritol 4-phosphate cytidylyltransferase